MKLENLCVYCGAATGHDRAFAIAAEQLGTLMAHAGVRLVYGGGAVGLMGVLARSVLAAGGQVTGIIPRFLMEREIMLNEVDDLVITTDMHERKRLMFERSDAFLALPGGIGTLEEIIEMMTWAQLGQHARPVVLANLKGFWDPLVTLLGHMENEGFIHRSPGGAGLYSAVDTVGAILPAIENLMADIGAQPAGAPALM